MKLKFSLPKVSLKRKAQAQAKAEAPAVAPKQKFDVKTLTAQFQNLQGRPPGLWPALPKSFLLAGILVVVVAVGYVAYWRGLIEEWETGERQELSLKDDYKKKLGDAVNLESLVLQRNEVLKHVNTLNKQLPSKAEMDALLSDINQAGVGRGLQFELFKPGTVAVKEYYAELPISVKVLGQYHDIGQFTSDIANMPRIVTLGNVNIVQMDKGGLAMEATAKTYRYLDQNEIDEQRKAREKEKAGSPGAVVATPDVGAKK